MRFKSGLRRKPIEYEKDLISQWRKNNTFRRSVEQRPAGNAFVFYDGPPFLTGTPHHGHLLISTVKDAVARYQTMKGKRVERRWGWDCHGLPAEVFVENKLGIKNKKEIGTKISIEDYVKECRAAMVKTGTEWEDTIDRIGRWVEFKGAYKTMDSDYMESVWWAFKELYEGGKIYEGEKILIYCTKDATPISKSEVAMENSYKQVTDPSVYVYFQLEDSDEYLLAWTTTPWTLPANAAVAVNEKLDYSLVEYENRQIFVASQAIEKVFTDEKHQALNYRIIKTIKGKALVGRKYHPLFENRGPGAHKVLSAPFVNAEEGTGIVHEAPAYGEDDYELCKQNGVPVVSIVDENGYYTEGPWQTGNIWDVNKQIAKSLVAEGKALKVEYIKHEYPHCHRCGNKLMYRAHPSWFLDIQGQKAEMLEASAQTNWTPKHLQKGRFRHIIESAPDWNLSRDRYWATPIPVWRGVRKDGTELIKVVGSYDEFYALTGKKLDDYHLPNVMNEKFDIDGVSLSHVGKVLDCWFESGSMPFAQFHYPFENRQKFKDNFPADFIVEAIDQTRGWFYSLTAVNVALFGRSPFKNLICTGFINAADGKKMSKKLKNYTDPMELMDKFSADSFRFLMLGSPLTNGEDFSLNDKDVADVNRKLNMVWNMFDFFSMYAEVDGWQWDGQVADPIEQLNNPLDVWIASRVHQVVTEVESNMDRYDLQNALQPILPFIDDASNWYVRRSRRRFWKSGDSEDKNQAYRTLHYVLVRLCMLLAPFTPFMADELYVKLTGDDSVHLKDWPPAGKIDKAVVEEMAEVRGYVSQGLSLRSQNQLKVRQPLHKMTVPSLGKVIDYEAIIKDEVNVKSVEAGREVMLDLEVTETLKKEGLAREIVRQIQNARKETGLNVDDRIRLSLSTDDKLLKEAVVGFSKEIKNETLAIHLQDRLAKEKGSKLVEVDGRNMHIQMEKVP